MITVHTQLRERPVLTGTSWRHCSTMCSIISDNDLNTKDEVLSYEMSIVRGMQSLKSIAISSSR